MFTTCAEVKRVDSGVKPTTSANSRLACWKLSAIGLSPASLRSAIDGGSTLCSSVLIWSCALIRSIWRSQAIRWVRSRK